MLPGSFIYYLGVADQLGSGVPPTDGSVPDQY